MLIRLLKPITKYPRGKILNVGIHGTETRTTHYIHVDADDVVHITPDMCELADADIEELRGAIQRADDLLKFAGHSCKQGDCTECDLIRAARKFIPKDE